MPFTGNVRRPEPHDYLAYEQICTVCFEYPFAGKADPKKFYNEMIVKADKALMKSEVHYDSKYIAEYDGRVIGGMCAMPYEVEFDGNTARMCGIGGVCTLPPYRRMGSIRATTLQMMRDEYEKGTEFSYLYPFSQSYYEKFGYTQSEPQVRWTFSLKHIAAHKQGAAQDGSVTLYQGETDDPSGFFEAYARMTGINMMVKRERCDFRKLLLANPFTTNDFAFLYRDGDGVPRGYLIFHKTKEAVGSVLDVTEMIYDSPDTLRSLLLFVAGYNTDYHFIRFFAPTCHNLESMITDMATGGCIREIHTNGMLRVIHTENALRLAKYKGNGEAVLRVADPFLGSDAAFAVRWKNGRFADMSSTSRAPDAVMDIGSFSAALMGRYSVDDFSFVKNMDVSKPDPLQGIFFKKGIHITNYF
jgi:predicted acetyltransferase